jgi:hypothetical protein
MSIVKAQVVGMLRWRKSHQKPTTPTTSKPVTPFIQRFMSGLSPESARVYASARASAPELSRPGGSHSQAQPAPCPSPPSGVAPARIPALRQGSRSVNTGRPPSASQSAVCVPR